MPIYLDMPPYLARWLQATAGKGHVVALPPRSPIVTMLRHAARPCKKGERPDLPRPGAIAVEVGRWAERTPHIPHRTRTRAVTLLKATLDTLLLTRLRCRHEPSEAQAIAAFLQETGIGAAHTDTIKKRYYRLKRAMRK